MVAPRPSRHPWGGRGDRIVPPRRVKPATGPEQLLENPLRLAARRPAAVAEPPLPPEHAVRLTVRDLRLEAERRPWAIRPLGAETPLLPRDVAASDPLVRLLTQLRAAVTRHVHTLRAEGAHPERMLVQVKAFMREAMTVEGWTDPEATRALTAEVARWSIDAYYDV
jgi:hypothetical protein